MKKANIILDNTPRNYLIISSNTDSRYRFIEDIIFDHIENSKDSLLDNPDILYVCLPIIDSSGNVISSLSNKDLILKKYGLIEKIDTNKIGKEITINQIREAISFSQISAHNEKKFIIINNANDLNIEASAALLKTLEEVPSNCSFILLSDSHDDIHDTVRSRCQILEIDDDYRIDEKLSFKDNFFNKHTYLRTIVDDYDLENLLNEVTNAIEGLLKKKLDPIEVSNMWGKSYVNFILEIVSEYIAFLCKQSLKEKYMQLSDSELKKLSYIYIKVPKIKRDLLLSINTKYLLNNLAIELAA